MSEVFRCGVIAVVGRPNVGKSTLVNALLGEKVAIVSPRPQTTRTAIRAIVNEPGAQLVLVDTPGVTTLRTALHKAMRRSVANSTADADGVLLVAEVHGDTPNVGDEEQRALDTARASGRPLVVALNKVDKLRRKEQLLPWLAHFEQTLGARCVVPVSALRKDGIDPLRRELIALLPEGEAIFPADLYTDQAERFLCAELVREQLLLQTREEIPHSAAVVIDSFEDERDNAERPICRLTGRIIVERESQKGVVVGKGGVRIKSMSQAARPQIEALLGSQVYLRLTVEVDPNWTRNESAVHEHGYGMNERLP